MSTSYHKHDKKASLSLALSFRKQTRTPGFTIVELLIVIVVVAILAAISIIAYNGITKQAAETTLKSDLKNASTQLGMHHSENGTYPDAEPPGSTTPPSNLKTSTGNTFQYTSTGSTYCLTATSTNESAVAFNVSSSSGVGEGACPGHADAEGNVSVAIEDGVDMQLITSANCPATRIRAVDARDNRTYWVQEMPDGKCWMLTNLAYAGGGDGKYGDVVTNLYDGSVMNGDYFRRYFVSGGANVTSGHTSPSASTSGSGQYGYLYNWCAASLGSCVAGATSPPNPGNSAVSICPSGWRLPQGGPGGEFFALNSAVNQGRTDTDQGLREST